MTFIEIEKTTNTFCGHNMYALSICDFSAFQTLLTGLYIDLTFFSCGCVGNLGYLILTCSNNTKKRKNVRVIRYGMF